MWKIQIFILCLIWRNVHGGLFFNNKLWSGEPHFDKEYDFIIIGSGSAGAVIANRLSEVPYWKILLIEAGEKASYINQIPIAAPFFQLTHYNWNYTMEVQDDMCLAMEDQKCSWPRGKGLGGTTLLNYMIYTRGHPKDYEKWAQENPGWSYDDVLPYFLKSENCDLEEYCDNNFHSQGGYLNVETPYKSQLCDSFISAGNEMGYSKIDYNADSLIGFSPMQANIKFGRRHSAASAFLKPISNRNNLKILTESQVTKILIDKDTKSAYGIEFIHNNKNYNINSTKEVVLSAGVLNSPQLLMLSGIGPLRDLMELGIEPIQDLPVGRTLYDHLSFVGLIFTVNHPYEPRSKLYEPYTSIEWFFMGKGFMTSLGGIEAIAYISTDNETYPDIELLLAGIGTLQFDRGIVSRPELRITHEVYNEYFKPLENTPCISILPVLLHPKSVGELKLKSNDPFDAPRGFGNYLTDPEGEDLKKLIQAIRFTQRLIETDSFQQLGAKLYDKPLPGCENFIFDTDSYWECAIRHLGVTLHHQISTNKMGQLPNAVVDSRLKVHGVEKLRVADTSVIPVTLSAHTSAPTMMLGEKAADLIKEDYGNEISDFK